MVLFENFPYNIIKSMKRKIGFIHILFVVMICFVTFLWLKTMYPDGVVKHLKSQIVCTYQEIVTDLQVPSNWKTYTLAGRIRFKAPPEYKVKWLDDKTVRVADTERNLEAIVDGRSSNSLYITAAMAGAYRYYDHVLSESLGDSSGKVEICPNYFTSILSNSPDPYRDRVTYSGSRYFKYTYSYLVAQFIDDANGPKIYEKILRTAIYIHK